jgi:hypothetical protein
MCFGVGKFLGMTTMVSDLLLQHSSDIGSHFRTSASASKTSSVSRSSTSFDGLSGLVQSFAHVLRALKLAIAQTRKMNLTLGAAQNYCWPDLTTICQM